MLITNNLAHLQKKREITLWLGLQDTWTRDKMIQVLETKDNMLHGLHLSRKDTLQKMDRWTTLISSGFLTETELFPDRLLCLKNFVVGLVLFSYCPPMLLVLRKGFWIVVRLRTLHFEIFPSLSDSIDWFVGEDDAWIGLPLVDFCLDNAQVYQCARKRTWFIPEFF